ncbi:hypothetical protein [Bradyrhizobium sp. SZCCHNR1093]|uniref:hypothetical protein n=1 Tax=Bradyrhizobium sp. SZCCHNR1093 TaxID=3057368 RepID=UPI0028EFDE21|nr:hypothetical protein [Bradyrhizobium sp. SZCCHNR1093]
MFRQFLIYCVAFTGFPPTAIGSGYGLLAAADKADFDKQFPGAHEKLVNFLNYMIYVMVEHTFPYVMLCALAAFIWVLIIAEPKAVAKRNFKERRLKVRS